MTRILVILILFFHLGASAQLRPMTYGEMQSNLSKIDKSIEETKRQMREMEDVRFLADLYFVLAEFLVEKSRYLYAIKNAENTDTPIEEMDYTFEKKPKQEAIGLYESFVEKFPTHPDRDRALFFKAHEHRDLGELEDMMKTYIRLTKDFPKSQFWGESKVVLGDYFLEQRKDLDLALENYNAVIQREPGLFTPLAHYKAGWVYINKEEFVKSFQHFESSLEVAKKTKLDDLPDLYKKTDIRESALLAIVWPYSELTPKQLIQLKRNTQTPLQYFRDLSFSYEAYQKVLSKLGRRLVLKKRFKDAALAYFELLRTSSDVLTRVDAIPRIYSAVKNRMKVWPVPDFTSEIAKTAVMLRHSKDIRSAEKITALKNFEIFARDASTRMQKRARASKQKNDYEQVIKNYKAYIWAFPKSPYITDMRMNLAENYFNLGDMLMAGMNYEYVAQRKTSPEKKRELYDSALQAYTSALKTPSKWDRLQLVQARTGLRGVGSIFLKKYKGDKAIPSIIFNIGQSYYDERKFGKAVRVLKTFIKAYPTNSEISVAANLILDAHNQRENYDALIKDGMAVVNNDRIKNQALKDNIKGIVQQTRMRKIQKENGSSSQKTYARNLLKFAKKYENSDLGDQALYEAFVTLKSQKDPNAYIPGEQLLKKHGSSQYAKQVVTAMGQMALLTADFRRAANYFETYAKKYRKDPEAQQLLRQATQLRESMGDFKRAQVGYIQLGDLTSAARMDFLANDWNSLKASSKKAVNPFSTYWHGLSLYRLGNVAAAQSVLGRASNAGGGSFEEQEMAAHATYLLAKEEFEKYERVQMSPGKEAQAVQAKNALLNSLTKKFNNVISAGSGRWTIAAFYGLGIAFKEFAQFIKKAPVPPGIGGAQLAQYKKAIEAQASGFTSKSSNFFKECMKNAESYGVFTRFVQGCESKGNTAVDEAREVRTIAKAGESSPSSANRIRRQLYDNSRSVPLLRELAQTYVQSQDYAMANTVLQRASEVQPDNAQVVAEIGSTLLFMNRFQEAGQMFKKALKVDPGNSLALYSMRGLYKMFSFKNKLRSIQSRVSGVSSPTGVVHPLARN